jgi:hypothetical protein
VDGGDVGEVEKRPGAILAAFPPLIFAGTTFVSVFCVSPPPPLGNTEGGGGIYIGVFRSSWASGDEDGRHQSLEAQTSMGGMAWLGARATWSCLAILAHLVDFLCSRRFP